MGLFVVRKQEQQAASPVQGLAGVILRMIDAWRRGVKSGTKRQMHVVETLDIGGRKQLVLVSCAGERFLVGTGQQSVQTIVRVHPESDTQHPSGALAAWPGERR